MEMDTTIAPAQTALGSAFLRAAMTGDAGAMRRGLESRDRRRLMEATDTQQRNAVHLAARGGHVAALRLLYDHGAAMEGRDRFGRTPLHLACEHARLLAVEALLDCGCQPHMQEKTGRCALHLAAAGAEDVRICKILLMCDPALVSKCDVHDRTPLFYAVTNKSIEMQCDVSRLLIETAAEASATDNYGMTPLHYAAQEGHANIVSLLLKLQADPNIEDRVEKRTPMQLATKDAVKRELRRAMGSSPRGEFVAHAVVSPPSPKFHAGASAADQFAGPPGSPQHAKEYLDGCPPHLRAFQSRFVQIMQRVQEGGIEQREHLKKQHLFSGSWMVNVNTHQ